MTSFQRQLNLYGFRRVSKGQDVGCYLHPQFQRDHPELVLEVKRLQQPGKIAAPIVQPVTWSSSLPGLLSLPTSSTSSGPKELDTSNMSSESESNNKHSNEKNENSTPHLCYEPGNVLRIIRNNTNEPICQQKKPIVSKLLSNLLGLVPKTPPSPATTTVPPPPPSLDVSSMGRATFKDVVPVREEADRAFRNQQWRTHSPCSQQQQSQQQQSQQQQSQQHQHPGVISHVDIVPQAIPASNVVGLSVAKNPGTVLSGLYNMTVPSDPRGSAHCTVPTEEGQPHRVLSYGLVTGSVHAKAMKKTISLTVPPPPPSAATATAASVSTVSSTTSATTSTSVQPWRKSGIGALSSNLFRGRTQNAMMRTSSDNVDSIMADNYAPIGPSHYPPLTMMELGGGAPAWGGTEVE